MIYNSKHRDSHVCTCKYNETLKVTPFQISESPNKYLRKGNLLYPIENANINMPILKAVSPMHIQFSKAPSAFIQLSDLSYLQVVYVHPIHQCKMPRPMESVKQIHDYSIYPSIFELATQLNELRVYNMNMRSSSSKTFLLHEYREA